MSCVHVLAALVALCAAAASDAAASSSYMDDLFQQVMAREMMSREQQHEQESRAATALRDQEYLQHGASLWGHQYMTGGAGEGYQRLRPEGSIQNIHQVKTDAHLPAYCNPPNPCPHGYTGPDECLEDMPNSAAFVREYQERQDCMCDKEHMISCPQTESGPRDEQEMLTNAIQTMLYPEGEETDFEDRHIGLVAKKGDTWNLGHNPYLTGDQLPVVAKKAPGMY